MPSVAELFSPECRAALTAGAASPAPPEIDAGPDVRSEPVGEAVPEDRSEYVTPRVEGPMQNTGPSVSTTLPVVPGNDTAPVSSGHSLPIAFTVFARVRDTLGAPLNRPWSELKAMLAGPHDVRPRGPKNGKGHDSGKDGTLIALATFGDERNDKGSLRHDKNVRSVSGALLDFDHVTNDQCDMVMAELDERQLDWVAYSSWSNSEDEPRFRIVLPYSRAVTVEEHYRIWDYLKSVFPEMDQRCRAPSHVFYTPACPEGSVPWTEVGHGGCLRIDGVLARVPVPVPTRADRSHAPVAPVVVDGAESYDTPASPNSLARALAAAATVPGPDNPGPGGDAFIDVAKIMKRFGVAWVDRWAVLDAWDNQHPNHQPRWSDDECDTDRRLAEIYESDRIPFGCEVEKDQAAAAQWRTMLGQLASDGTAGIEASQVGQAPFSRGDHAELSDRLVLILQAEAQVVCADGDIWQYDRERHIFAALEQDLLDRIVKKFAGAPSLSASGKPKPLFLRTGDIDGAVRLARSQVADRTFFADAPKGMVFENGFVEVVPEGTWIKPNSPENRARFGYPFPFEANAKPTRFLQFLNDIFFGDHDSQAKIDLVQEYVGTAMLGQCVSHQQVLVLLGGGSNGKGVLAKIIMAAMPKDSFVAIAPHDFEQEYRRAMIAGKLLNIVAESSPKEISDSTSFKAIVAGDLINGRPIRQEPFDFVPVAGHIFSLNRLFGTTDHSDAFWRRFTLLQFNRKFEGAAIVPDLEKQIIEVELPAVVSWFLLGGQRVLGRKRYTIPASSSAAIAAWRQDADYVQVFIADGYERLGLGSDKQTWAKASDLYSRYRTWSESNGHKVMASDTFADRMKAIGLERGRTSAGIHYPVRAKGQSVLFAPQLANVGAS